MNSDLSDLSDRVDNLETDLSDLQSESGASDLESDVEETRDTVTAICDELGFYSGAFADIYNAAC